MEDIKLEQIEMEKIEEDIKELREQFEKGDAAYPVVALKNQLVYFMNNQVSTYFNIAGYIDHNYRDLGIIFSNSYAYCSERMDALSRRIDELEDKCKHEPQSIDNTEIESMDDLVHEHGCYRVLELLTKKALDSTYLAPLHLEYGYTFLPNEYVPNKDYGYAESDLFSFTNDPSIDFERAISMADDLKPFTKVTYHVSNELQFCLAMLDYISECQYMLRRCQECGHFYIAEHGNETYCGKECREAAQKRAKDKSASEPLRKAWKRAYLRIYNRANVTGIDVTSLGFIDRKDIKVAESYINNDEKIALIEMIRVEMEERIAKAAGKKDEDNIIKWLDGIARKRIKA